MAAASPKRVLVTGASGFVGSHLCQALVDAVHDVRAMTRRPADYSGAGTAVAGDVEDASSLVPALDGADVAYYLVHALDSADFEAKDAQVKRARLPTFDVPVLTPRLSSLWLALVTDVDIATARNLVDSMSNEVIVRDRSIEQLVPGATIGYDEAVRRALAQRAAALEKA